VGELGVELVDAVVERHSLPAVTESWQFGACSGGSDELVLDARDVVVQ
jgi:hypothetical protein